MKNIQNTILLLAALFLFGCKPSAEKNNQSVFVKKTQEKYTLEASYPENKTAKVQAYINTALKQAHFFTSIDEKKDAEIIEGTSRFQIKAKPGYIFITFKKQLNSETSYQQLEEMCLGIKETLK